MSTRSIRTSTAIDQCDVCGRTLLRGETAEIYLSGGARRSVCELCTSRALHGGWVREGTVPEYDESSARYERRRSLLGRWRGRRDGAASADAEPELVDPDLAESSQGPAWLEIAGRGLGRNGGRERDDRGRERDDRGRERDGRARDGRERNGRERNGREREARGQDGREQRRREPRHVRAVPTSIEHKISSAVSLFNASEHPRTVAGIARSLGLPEVSVHPSESTTAVVNIVVAWELCWYRYEVDLSEEVPSVRVAAQGYELHELSEAELQINAVTDERGLLDLEAVS